MKYVPRVPQSFLEAFIFVLLMIPVLAYYLLTWIIKGIVILIASLGKPST